MSALDREIRIQPPRSTPGCPRRSRYARSPSSTYGCVTSSPGTGDGHDLHTAGPVHRERHTRSEVVDEVVVAVAEGEVGQRIEDHPAAMDLDALRDVSVVAENDVGPLVDHPPSKLARRFGDVPGLPGRPPPVEGRGSPNPHRPAPAGCPLASGGGPSPSPRAHPGARIRPRPPSSLRTCTRGRPSGHHSARRCAACVPRPSPFPAPTYPTPAR